jgi:hypothetical protein
MISSNDSNKFINYDSFSKILNWLAKDPNCQEQIGIIGGEPTLHPMFNNIITVLNDYCKQMGCDALIFTNGIELKRYLSHLGENIGVLLNCNSPKFQSKESYKKFLDTLYTAASLGMIENDKIRCGCNIYLGLNDYSYFWNDIVDIVHPKIIRCSVVCPGGCYQKEWKHQNKKEEYYKLLKSSFMEFVENAIKRKVILSLDCNQIPYCYFSDEERQKILNVIEFTPTTVCKPAVDINSNLEVSSCFGTYDIDKENKKILITDFKNVNELRDYLFFSKNVPKIEKNNGGQCNECDFYKMKQCQGGCLSFVDKL